MLRRTSGRPSRFFTFRKDALRAKQPGQKLRFTRGLGYWLSGKILRRKVRKPFTMFDSVSISQIPRDAKAVAGYVSGHWPTFESLVKGWPHAHHLSIATSVAHDAETLDVEPGDATIDQAAAWVKRQMQRGVHRPVVYTSVSMAARLMEALARAGIPRSAYRLWTAHYTFKPHLCTKKCGFGMSGTADATQYTDKALGRNLDASLVQPTFFDGPAV
jgi:hypothetical protein